MPSYAFSLEFLDPRGFYKRGFKKAGILAKLEFFSEAGGKTLSLTAQRQGPSLSDCRWTRRGWPAAPRAMSPPASRGVHVLVCDGKSGRGTGGRFLQLGLRRVCPQVFTTNLLGKKGFVGCRGELFLLMVFEINAPP